MFPESILSKLDQIEANGLKIAAQRDEAIKECQEWRAMANELAKALTDATERLDDLGVFGRGHHVDVLVRYTKMANKSCFNS